LGNSSKDMINCQTEVIKGKLEVYKFIQLLYYGGKK
jgi:hypothetical protein